MSLQNSQAVREHAGILTQTYLLPTASPGVQATIERGQEFAEMLKGLDKGAPSPIGPPHIHKFLAFLPKMVEEVEVLNQAQYLALLQSARTLIAHLEHLEMDQLQDLIKVFRVKEAYFDKQRSNKGVPMMKITMCLSEKEVLMGSEMAGEEVVPNFRDLVHEILMAQPEVSWKQGQAAASGLERGLQNALDAQGYNSKRKK